MKNKIIKNINDLKSIYKDYFDSYGGIKEIFCSIYFILSVILNIFAFNAWIDESWISNIQNIIPDIAGFSLGAYAILISFGSEKFQKFISQHNGNETNNTMYKQINTAFIHFILMQIIALIFSILGNSLLTMPYGIIEKIFAFIFHLVFVYSLMLCMAAVFTIFRIARVYQNYNNATLDD